MNQMVEAVARLIAPSRWAVMDSYLEQTKRKYAGQSVGWPADQFQDKDSMKLAAQIIAAVKEQMVPVAWAYRHPAHPKNREPAAVQFMRSELPLGDGWTETPLYAFPEE